ncbi:hypothetical protein GCM10025771_18610 [Niveibacterium umoris]|uniref:Uncharacterized protein n=1 Tax=Niveibacterium umoris TaxID=1193620 RepID=A0A840BIZ0_9RHOO|nr:hypothetical protein [Niveibacterium umoris]MBB4012950.1 hypothetical protein [Niveibacterium umoris]
MNTVAFEQIGRDEAREAFDAAFPQRGKAADTNTYQHGATADEPLTPGAREWLRSLPHQARAEHLSARHPHIANAIAARWQRPVEALNYLNELLVDHRGSRKGFSEPVVIELLHLHDLCTDALPRRNHLLPNDPWLAGNDPSDRNAEYR